MVEIWFVLIDGKCEGPYSIPQLKRNTRITPDTYVWKEGFTEWKPMRSVPELKEVFTDDPKTLPPKEDEKKAANLKKLTLSGQEELTLDFRRDLPPIIFWIIIGLIVLSYFIHKTFFNS